MASAERRRSTGCCGRPRDQPAPTWRSAPIAGDRRAGAEQRRQREPPGRRDGPAASVRAAAPARRRRGVELTPSCPRPAAEVARRGRRARASAGRWATSTTVRPPASRRTASSTLGLGRAVEVRRSARRAAAAGRRAGRRGPARRAGARRPTARRRARRAACRSPSGSRAHERREPGGVDRPRPPRRRWRRGGPSADVVGDRRGEQVRPLRHPGHRAAPRVGVERRPGRRRRRGPAPRCRRDEAEQHAEQRRLAAAARPGERATISPGSTASETSSSAGSAAAGIGDASARSTLDRARGAGRGRRVPVPRGRGRLVEHGRTPARRPPAPRRWRGSWHRPAQAAGTPRARARARTAPSAGRGGRRAAAARSRRRPAPRRRSRRSSSTSDDRNATRSVRHRRAPVARR